MIFVGMVYGDRLNDELGNTTDLSKLTDQCIFLNTAGHEHTIIGIVLPRYH